jgi:1,4-alpha-glucan branching enzyme
LPKPIGYLSLVLHAHLPFVRHPEHEEFLEEDWLFEAITESYLPLIRIFDQLASDKAPFKIVLSLSPTLISMLRDPFLQTRALRYMDRSIELAEKEMRRTRKTPEFHLLAGMYHSRLSQGRKLFSENGCDLVSAFKRLQDLGYLEIITCSATHAILPLAAANPKAVRAQIALAVAQYQGIFGRKPAGFWLPECAYAPGLDETLKDFGIEYFFLEAHGVLNGRPRPKFGTFAPIRCPSGVYAFGRDTVSSRQVWCGRTGYPGDADYRDFYRDIGFDLNPEVIRGHLQSNGERKFTGIKYFRVTGTENKEVYNRKLALEKATSHAEDFLKNRVLHAQKAAKAIKKTPLMVSLFDAELFGHWWFEGPEWIDCLARKACADFKTLEFITPSEYLQRHPKAQRVAPSMSSWGEGGYLEVWLNKKNDWIYKPIQSAAERISSLAQIHRDCGGETERALNQACRELLLAQSSDWAFQMNAAAVGYSTKRATGHLQNFERLCDAVSSGQVGLSWILEIEKQDNIFPDLDFRIFC